NARWARGGPFGSIAHGIAAVDAAYLDDAALELDHGTHRVLLCGRGIGAIERNPGSHQVAIYRSPQEYAGGIGERRWDSANEDATLAEGPNLPIIQGVIRHLGTGEMTDQKRNAVVFGLNPRGKGNGFCNRNAEPVHAGIDVKGRPPMPFSCAHERIPF